ncbi:MAG: hypothetical protein V3V49_09815 [Candidatus Krumholzibacteria bacterium]
MRRSLFVGSILGVMLITAGTARAFDERRSGFILGFGIGPSVTSFTQETRFSFFTTTIEKIPRESEFGLATSFKIGAGIGEQVMIYYVNNVSWFSVVDSTVRTTSNVAVINDVIIANSVGLVGISYYFEETVPSPYVMGVLGVSVWDAPFEDGSSALVGFGLGAGVGWEFKPHWSLEAMVNWGKPSDTLPFLGETEINAVSFVITIAGLAY